MTFPAYDRELAMKANERARRAEQRVQELEDGVRQHRADINEAAATDTDRALWRMLDGSDDR